MFMFTNDGLSEHDFAVYNDAGHEQFGLHIMGGAENTTKMIHWQMPDADVTWEFWCTVTGHKVSMFGDLIIGFSLSLTILNIQDGGCSSLDTLTIVLDLCFKNFFIE